MYVFSLVCKNDNNPYNNHIILSPVYKYVISITMVFFKEPPMHWLQTKAQTLCSAAQCEYDSIVCMIYMSCHRAHDETETSPFPV